MIAAAVFALVLFAPPAAGSPPPPAPSAMATATPPDDPAADLDQLRQLYATTCLAREYGAYDDLCDQLHQQVRAAERQAAQAARAARRAKRPVAPHPSAD